MKIFNMFWKKNTPPKEVKAFELSWRDLDEKSLEFLHQESAVQVQDTVKDHYQLVRKIFTLLVIMISLSTALGGFIFNEIQDCKPYIKLIVLASVALLYTLISIFILMRLLMTVEFRDPGRTPRKILNSRVFDNLKKDETYKCLVYSEIVNCQNQINQNKYVNVIRHKAIERLIISFITVYVIILFFLILFLFL